MQKRWVRLGHQVGVFAVFLGFGWLHATTLAPVSYDFVGSFQMVWTIVLAASAVLTGYAIGLPELARSRSNTMVMAMGSGVASILVVSVAQLALGSQLLPRSVIGLSLLTLPPWTLIFWNLSTDLNRRQTSRERVLVVARDDEAAALRGDLEESAERPAVVVAQIRPEDALVDLSSGRQPLLVLALEHDVSIVVLDAEAQADHSIVEQASVLHRQGVRFRTMSLFYEEWIGKLPVSELQRVALLFDVGELHRVQYTRSKRVLDVAFSLAGLFVLIPLTVGVACANLVGNRGPLLFRQTRVGKAGKPFEILKFRSMLPDDGSDQRDWTEVDDNRITAFGALLRRSHLDELPQLINVLRGEISLIGPRPEQVHYVEELQAKLPFYDTRHLCRPGLSGWAQVKFGYASDEGGALEKLQYDLYYLRRQGVSLDAKIAVRTLRHVFSTGGR